VSTADGQATRRPDARNRWVGVVRAHPVRAYFVITYIVSWTYWLLIHGLLDKDSYGTCFGEYGAGIRPDDTVCDVNILFGRFGD
jgi:hypothetical protein